MTRKPNQDELDRLEANIQRTRQEVQDDRVPPTVQEAEERHEEGEDLMPRTNSGNPL
jgi:hypothetical protein